MTTASKAAGSSIIRPTMRDVAALSGTSIKTVSRVLNRELGVSGELVDRVTHAAARLNYQPNLSARNLRRSDGKTNAIGLILEDVANPFSSSIHRAIEDVARQHGVVVFAGSVDEDPERERDLARSFTSRRVDGLIIIPTGRDQSYLALEQKNGIALVFVDRPPSLQDADYVGSDNESGGQQAAEHLIKHGHTRIAYLGDSELISTTHERFDGFRTVMNFHGIRIDNTLIRHGIRSSEQATTTALEILQSPAPPTAFFTSQNLITIGMVRALRILQLQNKIALVGFDEIPLADLIEPGITLVSQDTEGIGHVAAKILFDRLAGDKGPRKKVVLGVTLYERGSGEIPAP